MAVGYAGFRPLTAMSGRCSVHLLMRNVRASHKSKSPNEVQIAQVSQSLGPGRIRAGGSHTGLGAAFKGVIHHATEHVPSCLCVILTALLSKNIECITFFLNLLLL